MNKNARHKDRKKGTSQQQGKIIMEESGRHERNNNKLKARYRERNMDGKRQMVKMRIKAQNGKSELTRKKER